MADWCVNIASPGPGHNSIRTAIFYPPGAILLTAELQGAHQRRFANLGVAGVIAKPFDPLTLADQIAMTLGLS